jgi:hypothetical protein
MTHSELVKAAATWLRKRCSIVVTEISTGGSEQPDVIGWHGWHTVLVECKTSVADFRSDAKKWFRRFPEDSIGNYRFMFTPIGLVSHQDIPAGWGLVEVSPTGKAKKAVESQFFDKVNVQHEVGILTSLLKRIGQNAPSGVAIRCYTIESQGNPRASLGIELEQQFENRDGI